MMLICSSDLFNALDKGNLGNAQTAGLSDGMSQIFTTYPFQWLLAIKRGKGPNINCQISTSSQTSTIS